MITRKELIAKAAERANMTKKDTTAVIEAMLEIISEEMELDGGCVKLQNFGKFTSSLKPAFTGRNPRTGESVSVPAQVRVRFKASKRGE